MINDNNKHFIALVAMGGDYEGKIGQHSTMQPDVNAATQWAKERFNRHAVIVDMANYNNANSLSDNIADMIYRIGTNNGIVLPQLHVIQVKVIQYQVHLCSDYYDQTIHIPFDNLPGAPRPELETAIKYLYNAGYNILSYCAGKRNLSSYIISDTFKPLLDK